MNKKELENEIMKTQEQLKKLQAALDEAEKEVPEELIFNENDEYCYVDSTGDICWTSYAHLSSFDIGCVRNRRAFLEEKLAEIFAEKTQFIADLLHFKYLYDKDYEPNWNLRLPSKYFVCYGHDEKCYIVSSNITDEKMETIYFSSNEIAQKCADWLNKNTTN